MNWSMRRRLAVTYTTPLVVLLMIGFFSQRALRQADETHQWVEHTRQVLDQLTELHILLLTLDVEHRSYLFLGHEEHRRAAAAIPSRAAEVHRGLATLIADNPAQQQRLAALWTMIQEKFERTRRREELRRAKGLEAAIAELPMDDSNALRAALNEAITGMKSVEESLLDERSAANRASVASVNALIFWGTGIGVVVVLIAGTLIAKGMSDRIESGIQRIASTATEILAATTQQATGTQEQATAIQETSTTVHEVKQTAQVSSQKAHVVAEMVRRTAQTSQDGRRAAQETIQGMREARTRMEGIAERVLALSERDRRSARS